MNRRAFIGSLASVFLMSRSRRPFVSGSFGRLGKWFGSFGSGMPAILHGTEAVIHVNSVIENRLFLDHQEAKRWILQERRNREFSA